MNQEKSIPYSQYYQYMFYSAALFNISVAVSLVVDFESLYFLMGGENISLDPIARLFMQLSMGAVFLFGVMYGLIGRQPTAVGNSALALLGIVGKVFFFLMMTVYGLREIIPWGFASLSFVDLIYSLLFFEYLLRYNGQLKHSES
ncbi:hypothetical protein [Oceanicoccus sp. KOV_DT_Chl]|uniref:hypothetical protein n=1 Tax=Oceanicoccus sp. KOV_DT_Chl TaxID=1904639 RepID=UPI0011AF65A2|nr:hypothetical protein [Oceanicoccus sp. KOV_DT_Chl]